MLFYVFLLHSLHYLNYDLSNAARLSSHLPFGRIGQVAVTSSDFLDKARKAHLN